MEQRIPARGAMASPTDTLGVAVDGDDHCFAVRCRQRHNQYLRHRRVRDHCLRARDRGSGVCLGEDARRDRSFVAPSRVDQCGRDHGVAGRERVQHVAGHRRRLEGLKEGRREAGRGDEGRRCGSPSELLGQHAEIDESCTASADVFGEGERCPAEFGHRGPDLGVNAVGTCLDLSNRVGIERVGQKAPGAVSNHRLRVVEHEVHGSRSYRGRPRPRWLMMFRWISFVPMAIGCGMLWTQ